jgi:hypothetical protein
VSSEIIDLNNTTPAAPGGSVNVQWQKGASSGNDPATGLPIYPVSAYVASGGAGGSTHSEPLTDGNANFIFAATLTVGGDIIVVTGVPN